MMLYFGKNQKETKESDEFLEHLKQLKWLKAKDAREELFMSDADRTYQYGDMKYKYESIPFTTPTRALLNHLNRLFGFDLNVCFLNKYNDEKNALGWHSDDSPEIDQTQPIVVVSFGAEREIWWKEKSYKGEIPKENRQLLEHGSAFIMFPGFQEKYFHKIPKNDRPCGTRISLTFRKYK